MNRIAVALGMISIFALGSFPAPARSEPAPPCFGQILRSLVGDASGANNGAPVRPLTGKELRARLLQRGKDALKPVKIAGALGDFVFYPTLAPLQLLEEAIHVGMDQGAKRLWKVPFRYLRKNGAALAGYVAFYRYMDGSPLDFAAFYLFPKNENGTYLKDTETPERTDGLRVFVDGVPDDNRLGGFGKQDYTERFRKTAGIYLHPRDAADMMRQLAELTRTTGKPIAQLEILGHGMPGMLELGSDLLDGSKLSVLKGREVPFAKNAEIRFQSCFLGANSRVSDGNPGKAFLQTFGENLFQQGGTVTASNRILYVMNFDEKNATHRPGWDETAWRLFLQPLEFLGHGMTNLVFDMREPYRTVEIPPK